MGRDRGRGSGDGRGQEGPMKKATNYLNNNLSGTLENWDTEDLVKQAKSIGEELSKNRERSTSKIRNFLDQVNLIDAEYKGRRGAFDSSRVILLKPQLAYAVGRERGDLRKILSDFAQLFSAAADRVEGMKDFEKFRDFTHAVVAYHRFHGGSN